MNTNVRSIINWFIDGLALMGFLICFSLELTGLALHEWLGFAVGAVCLLHLTLHWDWVKKVTARFFTGVSWRSRLNYLVDGLLMLGLAIILFTGLLISDWLNLALSYYETWRWLHVSASLTALLLLVFKISLHARWIVTTFKRMLPARPVLSGGRLQSVPEGMSRRQFLVLMSVVGSAASLAGGTVLRKELFKDSESPAGLDEESQLFASTGVEQPVAEINSTSTPENVQMPTAVVQNVDPTEIPATATAVSNPLAAVSDSSACMVRCRKACSFPGRCRRYVDDNGNSKCDLGECL